MSVERLNPPGLPVGPAYHQVSIAAGTRFVSIAGQVARDADGTPVGAGDLAAQVTQSYLNVVTGLEGAGATVADLASVTVYVVGWTPDQMGPLMEGLVRATTQLGIEPGPLPPATLIGVAALAEPDLLVEIQATAVLA
ncbi:RidA family protein [Nocardioides sp.]|uniref:RidA family protein n=1 Tax=Nocardioides sp. TaxID=35761 RepID=UPI00272303EA|nr:RidA family protein [Nocardioides sp.]MDO9455512.1 RidA family protein [Nocardioides sp.]